MDFKWNLFQKIIDDSEQVSGHPIRKLCEDGVIDINCLRKWLVKTIYQKEQAKNEKSLTEIKLELSEQYQISVSSIEKIIYGRRW